eukprot:gene15204-17844_t
MTNELSAAVHRLDAVQAIRTLKHRYMAYCDQDYSPDDIASLFIEDGVWTSGFFGHYEGRNAIRDYFAGISGAIRFAGHLALNDIITVDGDRATGRWRLLMPCTMAEGDGLVARWMLGDYKEDYVRQDGVWLFARMDFFVNFSVGATESWVGTEAVRPATDTEQLERHRP